MYVSISPRGISMSKNLSIETISVLRCIYKHAGVLLFALRWLRGLEQVFRLRGSWGVWWPLGLKRSGQISTPHSTVNLQTSRLTLNWPISGTHTHTHTHTAQKHTASCKDTKKNFQDLIFIYFFNSFALMWTHLCT